MQKPSIDLQRLLAEEPFVRSLACSLLADEADDVVQQAFLQALEQQDAVAQPRSWFARVVRNLVTDNRRRRVRRDARQRAAAVPERVPSSSELLEGEERRRALVAAVDRLPTDQRTVVLLRYYEGMPPRRIAAELKLPVATVWNRLHAALQTLRQRLDAEHGDDRRAWLLPLVPFATQPRALPWREVIRGSAQPGLWMGVIAMTAKTKVAVAATLLVLASAWAVWQGGGSAAGVPRADGTQRQAVVANAELPHEPDLARERALVATPAHASTTTGTLLVHVQYADEPTAAANLTVSVGKEDSDVRFGKQRAVTDAMGTVRFDAVPLGEMLVAVRRASGWKRAEIRAGQTSECTLSITLGMQVSGVVVDGEGTPIGGAIVECASAAGAGVDAEQVAVSASDGSFTLRGWSTWGTLLGARALGRAASSLYYIQGKSGSIAQVRIELLNPGGCVEGTVVAGDGSPVPDAVVRVGNGRTDDISSTPQGADPMPAQVRTDSKGQFLAIGIPVGTQPIQVRALGLAPASATCEVRDNTTVAVRVTLTPGASCSGVVRSEAGEPAKGIEVLVGTFGDFLQYSTKTADDGSYELTGLPNGDFELEAGMRTMMDQELGHAKAQLHGEPGAKLHCDLTLSNGLALRGRVVDEDGKPIAVAHVVSEAEGRGTYWSAETLTSEDGRFVVAACPAGRKLTVEVSARTYELQQHTGIDPSSGPLQLRMLRDRSVHARVIGKVVGPAGELVDDVTVTAMRYKRRPDSVNGRATTDGNFSVEIPVPGNWEVRVAAGTTLPTVFMGTKKLQVGETWDLGTIQLTRGGTLAVRNSSEANLEYLVLDSHEQFRSGVYAPVPPLRTGLLVPGEYLLLVRGEGIAAHVMPFTIQADKETELEVLPTTGIQQRIEFVGATSGDLRRTVAFEVRHCDKLTLWTWAKGEPEGPFVGDVWLAPGSYTLVTRDREPAATATFTVGTEAGPPLRVELR